MLKKIFVAALVLFLFACTEDAPVSQTSHPQQAAPAVVETQTASTAQPPVPAADHLLVFILDPNGGPCRMQNSILEGMADELKGKVDVRYVMTTAKEDLQYFYAYGIRGLPSLLLADATGKEIKRLPPGVNPVDKVRELLQAIPN